MPKKKRTRKPLPARIPAILVELRGREGLSQRAAAALCDLPQYQWNRWERGARNPTFHDLDRIAKAFGVSVDLVFGP